MVKTIFNFFISYLLLYKTSMTKTHAMIKIYSTRKWYVCFQTKTTRQTSNQLLILYKTCWNYHASLWRLTLLWV